LYIAGRCRRRYLDVTGLWQTVDESARLNAILAIGNDELTWVQTGRDHRDFLICETDL
jgi:hypothetical protein